MCENCNSIAINITCFQPIGGTSHCILLWSQSGAVVWLMANHHSSRWTLWFALCANKYVLAHHTVRCKPWVTCTILLCQLLQDSWYTDYKGQNGCYSYILKYVIITNMYWLVQVLYANIDLCQPLSFGLCICTYHMCNNYIMYNVAIWLYLGWLDSCLEYWWSYY